MVTQTFETSNAVSESAIESTKKKIRNLEKRKQKLDKLNEKLKNGEQLDKDQKAALGQYEFVLGGLSVSKEMLKGFNTLNSEALELKSKQKLEQAQIVQEEKQVLVQQSVGVIEILRCVYCHKQVQNDLVSGESPVLDENELKMLMDFYNVHLNVFNHNEGLDLVGTASVVGETLFALLSSNDNQGSDLNKVYTVFIKLFESDYFSKLPLIHQTKQLHNETEEVSLTNVSEDSVESTKNEDFVESLAEENANLDEVSTQEEDDLDDTEVSDVIKTAEFVASKPAAVPQPIVPQPEEPQEEVAMQYEFMMPDEEAEKEVVEAAEQPEAEPEQVPEVNENEEKLPIKAWLNKVCNNQFPKSSFSFEFEDVPAEAEAAEETAVTPVVPTPVVPTPEESVVQPESNGTESPVAELALPAHISTLPITVSPTVETGLPPASFGISPSPVQNHLHPQPAKYDNVVVTTADENNHLYTEVHQQMQAQVEISAPNHNHIQMPPQLAQQTLSSMLPPALQSVPDPLPMPKEDSNYSQFQAAGDMVGLVENTSNVEPAQTRRPRHDSLRASQQILGDTVVSSSPRKNEPVSSTVNQQDSNVETTLNSEHMQSSELHSQVRNHTNSYSNNPAYAAKQTYRIPQQQVNNSSFYGQQQQRPGRQNYQQPGRNSYYNGQRNFQPAYNQGYRNEGMNNGGDPYGQRKYYRPANGQRGGNNGASYRSRSFRPQTGADQPNY